MTKTIESNGQGGNRWRVLVWGGAAVLLSLPLIAMQFTDEVNWTAFDFAIIGTMLAVACLGCELAARMSTDIAYRAAAGLAIGAGFLLVWINLAVGVIGSEDNPANLMFAAVLAIGLIGAAFSGLKARGLMRTLMVMAAVQVAIGAITLANGWGADGENWPQVILVLTGFFATMWLASAGLFRQAARNLGVADGAT